jgi:integrase
VGGPVPRSQRASALAELRPACGCQGIPQRDRSGHAQGGWQDPASAARRFEDVAQEWLQSNPSKRPTTYARDAATIRVHLLPALGSTRIGQVRPSDVQATIERMRRRGLGSRAIRTNYGVLRAILNWAVNTDIIDRSPCRGIRLPELTAVKKPVVSADDVLRLADAIDPDYRVAVFLGALGLRQAEVFGLRVGSINFLRRTVTVEATINEVEGQIVEGRGKTLNSNRTFSAPQEVLDELAAHLKRTGRTSPEDLVLQASGGGAVRATNFGIASTRRRSKRRASTGSPSTDSATLPAT